MRILITLFVVSLIVAVNSEIHGATRSEAMILSLLSSILYILIETYLSIEKYLKSKEERSEKQ